MLCPDQPEDNYCDGYGDCLYEPDWCSCSDAQALCEANGMYDVVFDEPEPYTGECDESGQVDSWGDGCEWYDMYPSGCGHYDTYDFQAFDMCCACQDDYSYDYYYYDYSYGGADGSFVAGAYEKGASSDDPADYQAIEIVVGDDGLMWTDAVTGEEFSLDFDCELGVLYTNDDCPYGDGEVVYIEEDGCLEFLGDSYCPVDTLTIDGGENIEDPMGMDEELATGLDMSPEIDGLELEPIMVTDMTF